MTTRFLFFSDPRRRTWLAACLAVVLLLAGCQQAGDMIEQPRIDPLEQSAFFADGRGSRSYVPGTVPQMDTAVDDPALTGLDPVTGEPVTAFPVEVTAELVVRGQERYDIYCVVCHGPAGAGDGRAVPFGLPQPRDLLSEEMKAATNGHFFDVITNGFGQMFPYGYRVKANDRWAVIAYIRALQLRGGPLEGELTPDELNQIGTMGAQP